MTEEVLQLEDMTIEQKLFLLKRVVSSLVSEGYESPSDAIRSSVIVLDAVYSEGLNTYLSLTKDCSSVKLGALQAKELIFSGFLSQKAPSDEEFMKDRANFHEVLDRMKTIEKAQEGLS